MKKNEKSVIIDEFSGVLKNARTALLVDYRGLTVDEMSTLRRQLRAVNSKMKIVKNTLAKRAVQDSNFQHLQKGLKGPTAVVYTEDSHLDFLKVVTKFQDDHPKVSYRSGVIDGTYFSAEQVPELIAIPPKEQLIAKIMGGLQSPVRSIMGALQAPLRNIASILKQISQKDSSSDESI